ncbi:MAG TPA: right-handed parallel beta-helix repeat-containing protein [Methylomirabilota bacterium]|nr:right-handed parallel beta-helix repeat-containing protein [Methylomirabilota bacterium]
MLHSSHALVALRGRLRHAVRAVAPSAALLAVLGSAAHAQTFYVDALSGSCSNSGAGTEAQPYCTITAAVTAHKGAGITIMVKPGIYREQVTVPASGASGSPFVIQAAGPGVVIDGSDDFSNAAQWTLLSGNVWLASSVSWGPLQVFLDGARIDSSTVAPASLPSRSYRWVSGSGLYVNAGGGSPATHMALVGHRKYGFNLSTKSFVTMDGFEISHTEDRGINMQTGCTDLIVSNNKVTFANSYGIQTVNGQRMTISGNTVSDCNFHGIGVTAGASACVVSNNESFRNAKPGTRVANGIYLFGATGNTISGNRLHDNQDTGLQFSGAANNNVSFNNRSWSNGDHGYDHLGSTGMIHVNDLAYGNFLDGFSFEGTAPGGQVHNCIAVNNGEYDLWVDDSSLPSFVSDYNLFWNSTAQAAIKVGSTTYATLAAYQASLGGPEPHSKGADPKFTNAAAGDFRLLAGSPAIDAGSSTALNWPATDAMGAARMDDPASANQGDGAVAFGDMGALEFDPGTVVPTPHAPVVIAPATVKSVKGQVVTFTVSASDSDGDAITSLTMVAVKMPANNGATFTPNATNTGGTFTWNPGAKLTGTFSVKFVAANALSGSATTSIQIKAASKKVEDGSAEPEPVGVPVVAMSQPWPNPSAGEMNFTLDLPEASDVDLGVFDMQGRCVYQEARSLSAGRSTLSWNGLSSSRQRVGSGMYFVRAKVGDVVLMRRVVRF